jgi:hypothetical protein
MRGRAKGAALVEETALEYADLGDLFAIVSREWHALGTRFRLGGQDSKSNRVRLEERKSLVVAVRNDIRHGRWSLLDTVRLKLAEAYATELLAVLL